MTEYFNREAERGILSIMMVNPSDLILGMSIIPHSKIFYDESHQLVFESMKRQYDANQPIDIVSTAYDLKTNNKIQTVNGAAGLAKIVGGALQVGHTEVYARILIELYLKRASVSLAQKLLLSAAEDDFDPFDHISKMQSEMDGLLQNAVSGGEQTFDKVLDETQEKWMRGSTNGLSGHSTGLHELDRISGGLTDGELTIVGARPGQGKTALVVTLLRNLAKQNIPCGMVSLEMSRHELAQRLISQESQIFAFKIKSGELNQYEKGILDNCKHGMKSWNIKIFDEGAMDLRKLRSKVVLWQRKHGIKVLFIDYLQLMSGYDKKNSSRENDIAEISRGLKILARELSIPIVALSQLSRRVEERPDKMPQLSDLRESGAIEQDADSVWFLMRPAYYKMTGQVDIGQRTYELNDVCILDQAKMRSGNTGQIALKFDGPLMRMSNYDNAGSGF